jgi:hypothetical protein
MRSTPRADLPAAYRIARPVAEMAVAPANDEAPPAAPPRAVRGFLAIMALLSIAGVLLVSALAR